METADRIISVAEGLVQEKGFGGLSFQDIAERVGIKKGSLYYHFPTKAELGRAIIERYRARMRAAAELAESENGDYWKALDHYLQPMRVFGREQGQACVAGILAGEQGELSPEMVQLLAQFFQEHEKWLSELLQKGRDRGDFDFVEEPAALGRLVLSAIEGALLIKRVKHDAAYFDQIITVIAALLGKNRADPG